MLPENFDFLESLMREEFPENQERVITEEEIERMTIKDDMTLVQKGVFIMKKGIDIQKRAVVINLHQYMNEKGGNEEIFPLIINQIDHWEDELLIESIGCFRKVFELGIVNEKNSNKFLDICVNQLTYETQNSWYQWLDLISEVIPTCRIPIIDEIFQNNEIAEMLSSKKAQKIRTKGAEILTTFLIGMLKLRNKRVSIHNPLNELENQSLQKYLNQAKNLFQDNQWVIRKICAEKLLEIGMQFNLNELSNIFSKEISELIEDEEIIIKVTSLITLFDVMLEKGQPIFDNQNMSKLILKNLPIIFEKVCEDGDSQLKLTKYLGKIAYGLFKHYPSVFEQLQQNIAQYFLGIINSQCDQQLQLNAAYNLPAMASIFANKTVLDCSAIILQFSLFIDDLAPSQTPPQSSTADASPINNGSESALDKFTFVNLFKKQKNAFDNDLNLQIIKQIALSLHEQFKLHNLDQQQKENYYNSFINFMKNETVRDFLIPNLGESIINMNISHCEIKAKYLVELVIDLYNRKHLAEQYRKDWRAFELLINQINMACISLNCRVLSQGIMSSLITLLSDQRVNEQIKPAIARLVSTLVYNNYRRLERQELVEQIICDLAKAKSISVRKAFLTFIEQSLTQSQFDKAPKMTKRFFVQNFYDTFICLQNDKQLAIRRRVCLLTEKIISRFFQTSKFVHQSHEVDKSQRIELFSLLDKFKNDKDDDISEIAYDCEIKAIKNKDLSEEEYYQRIEQEKKHDQYELDQENRDMKERIDEEQKRRQEEEHKYEIYKLLQDPKLQMQRRKTLRQTSKVSIQPSSNLNGKKMVKRNSCNDHQIIGLPSISPMYLPHSGSNENKYSGASISHSSTNVCSSMKNKLPMVKRYNSGVSSAKDFIKEDAYCSNIIPSTNHSSVLSSQSSNLSSVSSASSGSRIRGTSSSNVLKVNSMNKKKP
eukprot:403344647